MPNRAQLERELTSIQAEMGRIVRVPGELTDTQVARFAELEEAEKTTEALLEEAREAEREADDLKQRMRTSMDLGKERRPVDATPTGTAIAAGASRSYERLFGPPAKTSWQPGEFFRCIANGWHDPRLRPLAQMGEASGASGGLLVPSQLEKTLLDRAIHASIVLSRANISPMTTAQKTVAGFAATDQSTTMYGFTFQWLAESAEADVGSGLIRAILLNAWTGGVSVAASNELVADSGFEAELTARMGDAVAESLDESFISGDGASKPLGYLKSSALLVVAKEPGQGPASLLTENILAMLSHATTLANSVWVASPSTLPQLGTLTFSVGAETAASTLLTRAEDGTLSLAARPILFSHRCPILGQQGDISLCDFSSYVVGLRQGIGLESSGHVGFTRREQTYRCLIRCDGQPVIMSPYVGKDARQYSPFVTLQARV